MVHSGTYITPVQHTMIHCRARATVCPHQYQHNIYQNWTWIGSIHRLDWIEVGEMTVAPFLISTSCRTVYAVSYKL